MLGIAPAAQVPPRVVVGILIIEDDEEALVASCLPRAYLIYIAVSPDGHLQQGRAVLGHGALGQLSAGGRPRASVECPVGGTGRKVVGGQRAAVGGDELHVVVGHLRVPRAHAHQLRGGVGLGGVAALGPLQVLLAQPVAQHPLHMVGGSDEVVGGVEVDHVVGPEGIGLMGKDRRKGGHAAHVAVALHAQHVDGLAQCAVHVAVAAVAAAVGGILAVVDADGARVVVVFVVVGSHPFVAAIVVLVHQFHGIIVAPRGVVRAPGLNVADGRDVGIFGFDGRVEHVVAFGILVALLVAGGLIVLVAYLDELQVVGFGVPVGHASGAPLGRGVAVGILNGVEGVLHQGLGFVQREGVSVAQAHVDHEQWGSPEVFAELQIFVETESVAGEIAPVTVVVAGPPLDGPDGFLPLEGVVVATLALHVASAGEAEKAGTGVGQQLRQVGAQAVFSVFPRIGEHRHHVDAQLSAHVGQQHELSALVGGGGHDGGRELVPAPVADGSFERGLAKNHRSVFGTELGFQMLVENGRCLDPQTEGIGGVLGDAHAPKTCIADALGLRGRSTGSVDGQRLLLDVVHQIVGLELDGGASESRPAVHALLERSVLHQLGIKTALARVVDFLEEKPVLIVADDGAPLRGVKVHHGLCRRGEYGCAEKGSPDDAAL